MNCKINGSERTDHNTSVFNCFQELEKIFMIDNVRMGNEKCIVQVGCLKD